LTFFCDARWDLKTMFLTCQLSPRDFARGGSEQNVLDYTTRRKHTVSFLRRSMFIAHKFWMVSLQRSQIFIADNSMVNSCGISPTLIFNANYTEHELNQSHISLGAGTGTEQKGAYPQIPSCHCNIILYISKAIVIFPLSLNNGQVIYWHLILRIKVPIVLATLGSFNLSINVKTSLSS
jgi:hypothetical protein